MEDIEQENLQADNESKSGKSEKVEAENQDRHALETEDKESVANMTTVELEETTALIDDKTAEETKEDGKLESKK